MKYGKIRESACESHNRTLFNELFCLIQKNLRVEPFHSIDGDLKDLLHVNFESDDPIKFTDRDGRRGIIFPVKSYGGAMDNIVAYEDGASIVIEGGPYHYHHDINELLASLAGTLGYFKEHQSTREHRKKVEKINKIPIQYVD